MTANQQRALTKKQQINIVVKLLNSRRDRAEELRDRIAQGKGIRAHGQEFDLATLRESLDLWEAQHGEGKDQQPLPEQLQPQPKEQPWKQLPPRQPKLPPQEQEVATPQRKSAKPGCEKHIFSSPREVARNKDVDEADTLRHPASKRPASPSAGHSSLEKESPKSARRGARSPGQAEAESLTVKALKARLREHGLLGVLASGGCVEKAELQALWERFETWQQRPLQELQDQCEALGGPRFDNACDAAKYLIKSQSEPGRPSHSAGAAGAPSRSAGTGAPSFMAASKAFPAPKTWRIWGQTPPSSAPTVPPANPKVAPVATSPPNREQDAQKEASRILPLRRESFMNPTSWGFAVLQVPAGTKEVSAVQRAYRALMRKLHPDRAGVSEDVVKAVEKVREAKEACERGLSRQEPPEQPRELRSEVVCAAAGRRRFKLSWTAPAEKDSAPIRRYVVAAHDPAYGRALTITVLEPDYSEELRSFVAIEDLTSYVMAEEDLQKMPKLWTQSALQVQVAAANEAGQSKWTTLKIPLTGALAGIALSAPAPPVISPPGLGGSRPPGPAGGFTSAATMQNRTTALGENDVAAFDKELRKLKGHARLRAFLEPHKKNILQEWLRSVNWSSMGSKQDLVERVIFIREAMVC